MTAGTLVAVAYVLGWVPMFVFRVEVMSSALPFYGPAERWAVRLAAVVVSLHVVLACLILTFEVSLPVGRLAAAVALFFTALGFWWWGRTLIGPPRQRRLPQESPLRFRRDGAFGVVRHPLFFSYVVAALAPVVATADPRLLVTFAASFAVIALRAVQEERRLRTQLGGEYDDYCRRVKRLIPFVW